MFLSKIWFFIVAVAAAAAITVALVMPRPADRTSSTGERQRLQRACSVVGILLKNDALSRVQNASSTARGFGLGDLAKKASSGSIVSGTENGAARSKLNDLAKEFESSGVPRPTFMFLVDSQGRVVARFGIDDNSYGDVLSGFFALDDALSGYLRDDIWLYEENLYRVAATPVFTNSLTKTGALVIGYAFDKALAERIGNELNIGFGFYANGKAVAANHPIQVHDEIVGQFAKAAIADDFNTPTSCTVVQPFEVAAGGTEYLALVSPLPGEARDAPTFYATFVEKPTSIGFFGTLDAVVKDDLAFDKFPWIPLALIFAATVILGLGLMIFEIDIPVRRLGRDAVGLAQSEGQNRLHEDKHRGRFGSIARSVNIHVDKLARETRDAKKEFDQLIGPDPAASGLMGLPNQEASGSLPPPSEFKFSDSDPASADSFDLGIPKPPGSSPGLDLSTPPPAQSAKPPPPKPPAPKPPVPKPAAASAASTPPAASGTADDYQGKEYYEKVYQEFLALKRNCGESTASLTFEKFSRKLKKNSDALIAKHGCKSVKFQVYVKDGKAALKASPVK